MARKKKTATVRRCRCRECQDWDKHRESEFWPGHAQRRIKGHAAFRRIEGHAAINRVLAIADERQRRLIAGLLAVLICEDIYPSDPKRSYRNGVSAVADITGISRDTIRRGWKELKKPEFALTERMRRPGAGRKPVTRPK